MMRAEKRSVEGVVVKLLHHKRVDRGMILTPFETRCLRAGEIHELVSTDQAAAVCGDRVDRVGFLGFVEITRGGVVEIGDTVVHNGKSLGRVLGFDESHFPNHYNILLATESLITADDVQLAVEDHIVFES